MAIEQGPTGANTPAITKLIPEVPIKDGMLQPTNMEGLWYLSTVLAESGLVPDSYHRKPNDVFVAISWGMEIGLSANQSLQSVAVISGKPSIYGDAGLALVRASGLLEDINEYFEGEFGYDDYTAVCEVKRKDEKRVYKFTFSIEDAKLMGKWDKPNSKGKSIWQKYPKRMLRWRALWFALRDVFGDVLKGLHIYEEMADSIDMNEERPGIYAAADPGLRDGYDPNAPENKPGGDVVDAEFDPTDDAYVNPANADDDFVKVKDEPFVDGPDASLDGKAEMGARFTNVIGKENARYGNAFAQRAADVNGCPIEEILLDAIKNPEVFKSMFDKWLAKHKETSLTVEENPPVVEEESPSNEEVDHFSLVVGAAVNHYGAEVGDGTQALLRSYVSYISEMNGMTDAQIHAGLGADPGGWFNSFEQWYDHQQELEAEAAAKELVTEPAEKTTTEEMSKHLMKPTTVPEDKTPEGDPPEEKSTKMIPTDTPDGKPTKMIPTDTSFEVVQDGKISWPAFKQKWNTMPKKFFKDYMMQNIEVFKLAEEEAVAIAKRGRAKWNQFYEGEAYPPDGTLDAAEKLHEEAGAGGDDAEGNIERRWNYINSKYGNELAECLTKRGMASGGLSRQAKNMIIQDVLVKVGI